MPGNDPVTTMQQLVLKGMARTQQRVVDVVDAIPVTLPFAGRASRLAGVTDGSFEFTAQLLETQHRFVAGLLAAVAPGSTGPTVPPAAATNGTGATKSTRGTRATRNR